MDDSHPSTEEYYEILPSKKFRVSVKINRHLQFRKPEMTMRVESHVNARHYIQGNSISFDEHSLHSYGIEYISEGLCHTIEQTIRQLVYEIVNDLIKDAEYGPNSGKVIKDFRFP